MVQTPAEPRIYFVTTVVANRRHFFVERKRAARLGLIIRNACRMKGFNLLTFAILPDHVHLLVLTTSRRTLESERRGSLKQGGQSTDESVRREGPQQHPRVLESVRWGKQGKHSQAIDRPIARADRDLSRLMQTIKGNFSWQEPSGRFWKPRFHVLSVSDEESLARVIEYIINNFRKTNLPERYGRHPYVFFDQTLFNSLI